MLRNTLDLFAYSNIKRTTIRTFHFTDFYAKPWDERSEFNMPHLKVNVNGKRYTISGLTRGTCSKQILCALAKVDAELQASEALKKKRNAKSDSGDLYPSNEGPSDRSCQVHDSRRKSKREENKNLKNCKEGERNAKCGKKIAGQKSRSTKRITKLDSKGIQTSNVMLETLGIFDERQQDCSPTQHEEEELKVLENSLHTVKDLKRKVTEGDIVVSAKDDNKEINLEHQARETDHDTGISELHSDSSFETNQVLHNSEKESVADGPVKKNQLNQATPVEVKYASTNTDPMETTEVSDTRMRENEEVSFSEDQYIVAQLLGSETDVENDDECTCNCVYVDSDSDSEELQGEIKKVQGDLKLTEAKLVEQNKMIESLNALIRTDQRNVKADDVSDDVTKRIDELKRSIKLSNQLYDYQKLETRANALEFDRVESQIRRKRWHVESLLKELRSTRNNPPIGTGQGRTTDCLREGTLV